MKLKESFIFCLRLLSDDLSKDLRELRQYENFNGHLVLETYSN